MRIHSILGGFHLMEPTSEQLRRTADFLAENRGIEHYPCHCTCFAAKAAIPRHVPVREIGSGTVLEWEQDWRRSKYLSLRWINRYNFRFKKIFSNGWGCGIIQAEK